MKISREVPRPTAGGRDAAGPGRTQQIGEVANRLGLSLRSIRYYEEVGLVRPSARSAGGFRLYSENDVQRLLVIMQMKPLDYTLDEMRVVLETMDRLAATTDPDPLDVERLAEFAADVEDRWASLRDRVEIASRFRSYLKAELESYGEPLVEVGAATGDDRLPG